MPRIEPKKLASLYGSYQNSANVDFGDLGLRTFAVNAGITDGKLPNNDGKVISLAHSNTNGYESQLAVNHSNQLFTRQNSPNGWSAWQRYAPLPTRIALDSTVDTYTTLSYTGITFTIPAYCAFAVWVECYYTNSEAKEVAISSSNTSINSWQTRARVTDANSCSFAGYSDDSEKPIFVWARYSSAKKNRIRVHGWYMPV